MVQILFVKLDQPEPPRNTEQEMREVASDRTSSAYRLAINKVDQLIGELTAAPPCIEMRGMKDNFIFFNIISFSFLVYSHISYGKY